LGYSVALCGATPGLLSDHVEYRLVGSRGSSGVLLDDPLGSPGYALALAEQIWHNFVQQEGGGQVSVSSEYDRAEQVVADVALLHDMAAGGMDEQRVRDAARVLLEHRRRELPSVSVAVAARLLEVSRTTVEAWRQTGVLTPAPAQRRRHEVSVDSLVRVQALLGKLRQLGRDRELRDYIWWTGEDAADYADSRLAEALRQLRAGELGEEYVPSDEDLEWARRELGDPAAEEPH
jgi:hypothetical protein